MSLDGRAQLSTAELEELRDRDYTFIETLYQEYRQSAKAFVSGERKELFDGYDEEGLSSVFRWFESRQFQPDPKLGDEYYCARKKELWDLYSSDDPILIDCMPKIIPAYYHSVIFNSNNSSAWNSDVLHLKTLETQLDEYITSDDRAYIVASHYFGSDADAARYLSRRSADNPFQLFTPTTEKRAHIHVVYYSTSRDGNASIPGVIKRWRRNGRLGFWARERKVKCLHCISQYLSQGKGRLLRTQRISSGDEEKRCVSELGYPDAAKAYDIQCQDACDDENGDLESKNIVYKL